MTEQHPDNVVPLHAVANETPPTLDTLLDASFLVWDEDNVIRLRCKANVSHPQVAEWLRHVADHLDEHEAHDHD